MVQHGAWTRFRIQSRFCIVDFYKRLNIFHSWFDVTPKKAPSSSEEQAPFKAMAEMRRIHAKQQDHRICSQDEVFQSRSSKMSSFFQKHGFPSTNINSPLPTSPPFPTHLPRPPLPLDATNTALSLSSPTTLPASAFNTLSSIISAIYSIIPAPDRSSPLCLPLEPLPH